MLILKLNTSPKSSRIELCNDTFAERKFCQVFSYESETFNRRRRNGISHCENGEQNPQNFPFPLHDVDAHLIQQCLGPRHAPPQTAANRGGLPIRQNRQLPKVRNGAEAHDFSVKKIKFSVKKIASLVVKMCQPITEHWLTVTIFSTKRGHSLSRVHQQQYLA